MNDEPSTSDPIWLAVISRDPENDSVLILTFNRPPTNNEFVAIREGVRAALPPIPS